MLKGGTTTAKRAGDGLPAVISGELLAAGGASAYEKVVGQGCSSPLNSVLDGQQGWAARNAPCILSEQTVFLAIG